MTLTVLTIRTVCGYQTFDGKEVPPLPAAADIINVSDVNGFAAALQSLQPGQTILMADGEYDISGIEPLQIRVNGTVIRGASGNPTLTAIRGNGFESCVDPDEEMLMLFTSDITIADLTISESRCHGIKIEHDAVDNLLLHNVRFINIGERCIKGGNAYNPENNTIRYCHFEDTKIPAADRCGAHFEGNYIGGMDVMNASAWVVHDNVFRNIKGATGGGRGGIFFWQGCTNMTVERNTFIDCDVSIAFGNPSGENDVTTGIIRNNFIVRGAYIAMEICNSSGIAVYHNTVYSQDPVYFRTISFFRCAGGNEFKNNIVFGNFWENEGIMPDTANNIWLSNIGDQNTDWFTDLANGDLHLTANATQAIDNGISLGNNVQLDWDGHGRTGALDIGADEYNSLAVILYTFPQLRKSIYDLSVIIYDVRGRNIRALSEGKVIPGNYFIR
jgi:hypothetical protein